MRIFHCCCGCFDLKEEQEEDNVEGGRTKTHTEVSCHRARIKVGHVPVAGCDLRRRKVFLFRLLGAAAAISFGWRSAFLRARAAFFGCLHVCECDGVCSYTGCRTSVSERARTSRISQEEATAGRRNEKKKKSKRAVLPEDFYSQNHQRKRVCVCAHERTQPHTCALSRDSVWPEGGGEKEVR